MFQIRFLQEIYLEKTNFMTQQEPLISVIIPCYNAENYIQECIDSILMQDYGNIEIIVIDDGSKDQSVKMLAPYLDQITLIQQPNQGACVARNKGLEVATGEFIKFLDADDYLDQGALRFQAEKLLALPENCIVYGDLIQDRDDGLISRRYTQMDNNKSVEMLILKGIITSLPLHRKSLLQKIGGFDPRFKNGQEWNLHIRLAASGVQFIHHPKNIYFQRIHNGVDRISNINQKNMDYRYQAQKRLMTIETLEKKAPISESVRQTFAYSIWLFGRRALLADDKTAAQDCFKISRSVDSNIQRFFPARYNILVRIMDSIKKAAVKNRG